MSNILHLPMPLAQVDAARTIALLAQDTDCASILGRDCLPPLIKLLRASEQKPTCQEAVVQVRLHAMIFFSTAKIYCQDKLNLT